MGWLVLAAALAYLSRNSVGPLESTIREDLGLTKEQSGQFMGAFFWTYAIMQVPGGWLGQAWGTRWAFALMALMWSLGAAVLGMSTALWMLIAAQLLMGAAQAGLMPCAAITVSHWAPMNRRSASCGAVGMGLQVGGVLAGSLTAFLLSTNGAGLQWRTIFLLYAIPGAAWAVWFFARFRDHPEQDRAVNAAELALIRSGDTHSKGHASSDPTPWLALAKSPTMWWLCGQQIGRSSGYAFFTTWLATFLQETRQVSKENSGYAQSVVIGGALVGCLLGGVFSDWLWTRTRSLNVSRRAFGAATQLACGLMILGAFFVTDAGVLIGLLALGAFCSFAGGTNALAVSIDVGGRHAPHVYAIQNMMGCFASAYIPALVGRMFDVAKRPEDWNRVLLMFAGIYFVTALCWALVNPTRKIERNVVFA